MRRSTPSLSLSSKYFKTGTSSCLTLAADRERGPFFSFVGVVVLHSSLSQGKCFALGAVADAWISCDRVVTTVPTACAAVLSLLLLLLVLLVFVVILEGR